MSRNFDNTFANTHPAALYGQLNLSISSPPSPPSPSHPAPPLHVVPAPPPDRPKRKRLARACNSCHKSKRRCDGTAPCSNCYYASKPCTYTDASGKIVPAPRIASIGPGAATPNPGNASSAQLPIGMAQNTNPEDARPSPGSRSFRSQQSLYGHAGPPYYLPPPSIPPLLPHQHLYLPLTQFSSNLYPPLLGIPVREWDAVEPSSSTFPPQSENLSRKRQRQGSTSFDSREILDANRARNKEDQETASDIAGYRSTAFEPTLVGGYAARPSIELEPALTRELTNLFFTHSHPMVMIIHKPSFTNAVTMNQVPMYLLYAVCALASRHSKQPSLAANPRRLSGRRFADEAVRLMFAPTKKHSVSGRPGNSTTLIQQEEVELQNFTRGINVGEDEDDDKSERASRTADLYRGELILPASLYTAQTLCLLAVYELLAWEPSAGVHNIGDSINQEPKLLSPPGERFRELTLQMLRELGVHAPAYPLLTPVPSQAFIEESIEKECIRRIFWLIYILDCLREIYYQGEGPLLGGSGRGYHSGGNGGKDSSRVAVAQSSVPSQVDPQMPVNSVSLPESSTNMTFNMPNMLSIPSPFTDHSSSLSFSPTMRAFSNGFIGFSAEELRVRLPVDETSFEMGVVHECLPEFLYLPSTPAPSKDLRSYKTPSMGSELAQTIRILSIYNKIERTLDGLYQPPLHTAKNDPMSFSKLHVRHYQARASLSTAITDDHQLFSFWDESHPSILRWDEGENVVVQKSMLETNSNTGAWCFCLIAILEASCIMGLGMGRRAIHGERWPYREGTATMKDVEIIEYEAPNEVTPTGFNEIGPGPDWWRVSHRKDRSDETDLDWGVRRLDNVLETLGDRAASSAASAWIWPLIKYMHRSDEKVQKGLNGFEDFCGVRMDKLAGNNWGASPMGRSSDPTDAEMADATLLNAEFPMATHQDGLAHHSMPDSLSSSSTSPIASATPGYDGSANQLPMLQTQTSLPSLKSSGLLDWSSRSSLASHQGATPLHNHSLPQLNVGTPNLNSYAGGGSPRTPGLLTTPTSASTVISMSLPGSSGMKVPGNTSIDTAAAQSGPSNTQQGRSGLSWMMNE